MMKLYGSYTSPYVRHCRIALIQGKMDWQFVEIDASESAERTPTKKVPFLHDGDIRLTDSCSILKYVREKSARHFFKDTHDYDLFCMANTVLDTSMNLFQLDRDGIDLTQGTYFGRQKQRIESALDALNDTVSRADRSLTDGVLRLACLLEWGLFRHRFDLDTRKGLRQVIVLANEEAAFSSTAIPQRFA